MNTCQNYFATKSFAQNILTPQNSLIETLRLIKSAPKNSTILLKLRYLDANLVGSLISRALINQILLQNVKVKILVTATQKSDEINLLNSLYQLHVEKKLDPHGQPIEMRAVDVHTLSSQTKLSENTIIVNKPSNELVMLKTNRDFKDDLYFANKSPSNLEISNRNDQLETTSFSTQLIKNTQSEVDIFDSDWKNSTAIAVNTSKFQNSNFLTGNISSKGMILRKARLSANALFKSVFGQNAPQNSSLNDLLQKILEPST